jgi:hypothetical protein
MDSITSHRQPVSREKLLQLLDTHDIHHNARKSILAGRMGLELPSGEVVKLADDQVRDHATASGPCPAGAATKRAQELIAESRPPATRDLGDAIVELMDAKRAGRAPAAWATEPTVTTTPLSEPASPMQTALALCAQIRAARAQATALSPSPRVHVLPTHSHSQKRTQCTK